MQWSGLSLILSEQQLTRVLINTLVTHSKNINKQYIIKNHDEILYILSYYKINGKNIKDNPELYEELKKIVSDMDIVYINIKTEDIL